MAGTPKTYVSHMRLTWSGVFGTAAASPSEIWSCSLAIGQPGTQPGTVSLPAQGIFDGIVTTLSGYHAQTALGITSHCFLTGVKLAFVGANGHVQRNADGSFAQYVKVLDAPVAGGSGNPAQPFQVALAVSLQSNLPGRTGRGRFFLPGVAFGIDNAGRIPATNVQAVADATKQLIDTLNQSPIGPTSAVVIASAGSVKQGLPPANQKVTTVRVGNVYDTLRTRRNRLREAYSAATV